MRTGFIAGNWKMNLTVAESCALARSVREAADAASDVDVAVGPVFTSLAAVIEELRGSRVAVAAQNCHWESQGAYTGEVSAPFLADLGASHVIIGHSERRQFFGETDETVNKKLKAVLATGLKPILCIGESLDERESGQTKTVVTRQVKGGLADLTADQLGHLTLAYEPVWAIGTGKTASPEQAQEVHAHLRALLGELLGADLAEQTRIQYGGSVKPSNVKELMAQPDIDGALVGGASLKADSFSALIRYKD